jgi:hypothetical protein
MLVSCLAYSLTLQPWTESVFCFENSPVFVVIHYMPEVFRNAHHTGGRHSQKSFFLLFSMTSVIGIKNCDWGAINWAALQELDSNSWNPKVQYSIHKCPLLVPILSPINPIHTIPSYLRSILRLSTQLHLGLPSGLFYSGFPTNTL